MGPELRLVSGGVDGNCSCCLVCDCAVSFGDWPVNAINGYDWRPTGVVGKPTGPAPFGWMISKVGFYRIEVKVEQCFFENRAAANDAIERAWLPESAARFARCVDSL